MNSNIIFFGEIELEKARELQKILKTGTTTIGLKAVDCVVLAADTQATMDNLVADSSATKIYRINDRCAVTIAGGMGDSQTVVRFLRSHANAYELDREKAMSCKAIITYLANILNANRYYPFLAFFILGGYDKKPVLYSTDFVGGFSEVEEFTSIGSGSQFAMGYLEQNFKENLSEEQAIEIGVNAIKVARKRDIYTGGKTIRVFVINREKARELSEKEVKKYLTEEAEIKTKSK